MDNNESFENIARGAFLPVEQIMGPEMAELMREEKRAHTQANIAIMEQYLRLKRQQVLLLQWANVGVGFVVGAGIVTYLRWVFTS